MNHMTGTRWSRSIPGVEGAVVKHVNDGNNITSHMTGSRWSRSIPGVGGAVVKTLLKGTLEVETRSTVSRKFLKRGRKSDAIRDFNSLNSDIISNHGYGATGVLGDTRVRLRLIDEKNRGLPTLQIWDPNMDKSIRIHYIKPLGANRKRSITR